jgi:hypothetical protein
LWRHECHLSDSKNFCLRAYLSNFHAASAGGRNHNLLCPRKTSSARDEARRDAPQPKTLKGGFPARIESFETLLRDETV